MHQVQTFVGDPCWWFYRPVSADDFIRCPQCRGQLLPSGVEVHRHVCEGCGQNYHAILQFVPVDPIRRVEGLLGSGDATASPTSEGGDTIPSTLR